jgi:CubicO group peptidase (beta-lactamase class C family)
MSTAALQELCARTIAELGIVGAQIAVAVDGALVHAEAGIANSELNAPVTADTCFQIGSTSKLYTATLVMQLADEGLVDIDRPVTDYLPDVRLACGAVEEWRAITPRHLMSMTSGLDNGPYTDTGRDDACVARYVDLLAEVPLVFTPGSAYGYSNASTNVSGLLIERLTGQCWDEALRDRLLEPAGLTESVSLFEQLPYHRIAVGSRPRTRMAARPWCFGRGSGPAGSSLAATARDLVRFGQLFLRRGLAIDGTRILSESAVDAMHSVQVEVPARVLSDAWCVGPYRKTWGGAQVYGHSGTTSNGASTLLWIPDADLVIATTVNTATRGYPFADAVLDTVLGEWLGVAKPPRPVPTLDPTPNPGSYLGRYDSFCVRYEVTLQDGDLVLTVFRLRDFPIVADEPDMIRTVLRPIAPHRFFPDNDAVTWHHAWDIAFTFGADERAAFLYNGAFAACRSD